MASRAQATACHTQSWVVEWWREGTWLGVLRRTGGVHWHHQHEHYHEDGQVVMMDPPWPHLSTGQGFERIRLWSRSGPPLTHRTHARTHSPPRLYGRRWGGVDPSIRLAGRTESGRWVARGAVVTSACMGLSELLNNGRAFDTGVLWGSSQGMQRPDPGSEAPAVSGTYSGEFVVRGS